MAVLAGLFLSLLNTRLLTKQLQLCPFKPGCHLHCRKQPLSFQLLRTCRQSSKGTRNDLCLTLRFRSTGAGVSPSHRWPRSGAGGLRPASSRGNPAPSVAKSSGGGSTGAWKTLGTWPLIDFTVMFDTESGDNIPVVITLKTCTVIQNKCQRLPSLAHAAF